jgi:hypothetical protein
METVKNRIYDLFQNPQLANQLIERNHGFVRDNLTLLIHKIY